MHQSKQNQLHLLTYSFCLNSNDRLQFSNIAFNVIVLKKQICNKSILFWKNYTIFAKYSAYMNFASVALFQGKI